MMELIIVAGMALGTYISNSYEDERRSKRKSSRRRSKRDNSWLDAAWFHDHGQSL